MSWIHIHYVGVYSLVLWEWPSPSIIWDSHLPVFIGDKVMYRLVRLSSSRAWINILVVLRFPCSRRTHHCLLVDLVRVVDSAFIRSDTMRQLIWRQDCVGYSPIFHESRIGCNLWIQRFVSVPKLSHLVSCSGVVWWSLNVAQNCYYLG